MKEKAEIKSKKGKKPSKYDEVFVIKGSFDDLVTAAVNTPKPEKRKVKS